MTISLGRLCTVPFLFSLVLLASSAALAQAPIPLPDAPLPAAGAPMAPQPPTAPPLSVQDQATMQSVFQIEANANFVNVGSLPNVKLDLRYASENNFLKKNLYGTFNRAFLHKVAAEKLKKAAEALAKAKPGYQLLLFDCLRPRSVQRILWATVVKTEEEKYVADPNEGSIHNYGFAVDLSLQDAAGKEVDMGTGFDFFGPLSEPALEEKFLAGGQLTATQMENRRLLRKLMTDAGFLQLASEWWHYDALPAREVRRGYQIVE